MTCNYLSTYPGYLCGGGGVINKNDLNANSPTRQLIKTKLFRNIQVYRLGAITRRTSGCLLLERTSDLMLTGMLQWLGAIRRTSGCKIQGEPVFVCFKEN